MVEISKLFIKGVLVLHFFLAAIDSSNDRCPEWLTSYQKFHNEAKMVAPKGYLVCQCDTRFSHGICGGLSDRIRSLPFLLKLAARLNRVFLYRWLTTSNSSNVENYFSPNLIDWRYPDHFNARTPHLIRKIDGDVYDFEFYKHTKEISPNMTIYIETNRLFPDGLFQEEKCAHHALFKPIDRIDALVKQEQKELGISPHQYVAIQYRNIESQEGHVRGLPQTFKEDVKILIRCAEVIRDIHFPGSREKVLFISDTEESKKIVTEISGGNVSTSRRKFVHIDKHMGQSYDDAFVDFTLMSRSGCILRAAKGFFGITASRFMEKECLYAPEECHALTHSWI